MSFPRRDRRNASSNSSPEDGRSPFQHDRDRLLYSSAFRRLAEVTQVVAANNGYVFHNRLTHSLQVAQVGRRMAETLVRQYANIFEIAQHLDPDVVEAAALAHDLGHPPFGHVIEEALNVLGSSCGGFEGNAQTFRIITGLAFNSPRYQGLNLTRATLAATMKYPWAKGENPSKPKKWGYYQSEKEDFEFTRKQATKLIPSIEAQLMDWADDVTYCVHDLEDFYRAGRIPLHLMISQNDDAEREYFFESVDARNKTLENQYYLANRSDLEAAFTELLSWTLSPTQPYRGTQDQRGRLRSFISALIGRYVNAVSLSEQHGVPVLEKNRDLQNEVFMLKELTWTYVIEDPSLASQQVGQKQMVKKLFEIYVENSLTEGSWKLFPVFYQERLRTTQTDDDRKRVCLDLIAGMTETQVRQTYLRVMGTSTESSLSDPLR